MLFFIFSLLKAQDNKITFNNQRLFLSGMNLAWIDYGNDLSDLDIEEFKGALDEVKEAGGNCLRWWLHINGVYSPTFTNDSVSGISQACIENLRMACDFAYERGMSIMPCLWSFGMLDYTSGSLDETQAQINRRMLVEDEYLDAYIRNALIPMVDSLKGHPAIACWEIFNEPEGMALDAHSWAGWTPLKVSFVYIQKFMNRVAGAIHRTDPNALVSSGAWNVAVNTDVTLSGNMQSSGNLYRDDRLIAAGGDNDGTLDFYMIHYYPDHGIGTSPFHHPASYWQLDKPIVVGEFRALDPYPGIDADSAYRYLYHNGYAGGLAWTWTGHDGNGGLEDAAPGIQKLATLYTDSVTMIIDSSLINFYPKYIGSLNDIFNQVQSDSVVVQFKLDSVFLDYEDQYSLDLTIQSIFDTGIVKAEIDTNKLLTITVIANSPGFSNIVIRGTDSGNKFVDKTIFVSIYDPASEDLALYRKVTSSSIENSNYYPVYAVDGNSTTRWSTEYEDDEWITVELEQSKTFSRIEMSWEAAYGHIFNILYSEDGNSWNTAYTELYGNGAYDLFVFEQPITAKYISMEGIERGTDWGYSLWSFSIYESMGTNTLPEYSGKNDTITVEANDSTKESLRNYFVDNTEGDQLIFSAVQDNGSPLPDWIEIRKPLDQRNAEIVAKPSMEDIGTVLVASVTAKDRYNDSVTIDLNIVVVEPTSVEKPELSKIKIYPNPADNILYIENTNSINSVEMFDIQGRKILSRSTDETGITEINISGINAGIYYIKLNAGEKTVIRKFIKI